MFRTSRILPTLRLASASLALFLLFSSSQALAEPVDTAQPEAAGLSLAITPFHQFDAALNSGGSLEISRLFVDVNGHKGLSEQLEAGFHFAYDYTQYHFSGPVTFLGGNSWDKIHRLELGGSVGYDLTPEWSLFIAPSLQLSRAEDAGWGNALAYGGIISLSKDLSKELTLGLGFGAFNDLEELNFFPMIVINWKITDRLLLANPFHPGPTGPAGLELAYRMDDGWDLGVGTAYRSNRFRLAGDDAIAKSNSIPAWLRLSRNMSKKFNFDCYAGAMLGGQMSIDDRNGNRITSASLNPAPFLAVAFSAKF